ncbi:aldose epimerase family protein [Flammeovirga sp. EKP202]|uniref:aldose epimerase family protein n=1 Tax=Flammeovirga sp. EKP202 TaxID=2770592 RepID=UPI00165FF6E1|nr:aldose epimerase family protein [Flammeovirga sp. EKP202]MBD0401574.1 galactose mutarotase [Flammeovirga sp. EKP202]
MLRKLLVISLLFLMSCSGVANDQKEEKRRSENTTFEIITLQNKNGSRVDITNYGARIAAWYVKDKMDSLRNIVLGFSTLQQYQKAGAPYYGAIIGRYANRLQNFELDGNKINLTSDEYILHGGKSGCHDKFWKLENVTSNKVKLGYEFKDNEGGFPGNLKVSVEYKLTDENELVINYFATTDKKTVLNLSNHAFFNLKGAGNGSVLDLQLMVNADRFTPLKKGGLPTGEIRAVDYSVFDFRSLKSVREVIESRNEQINLANGLDHNFIKKNNDIPFITAIDPQSGIKMEMKTTLPAAQIYTANFLSGKDRSDDGKAFKARESICFEAQFYPNSPHHSNFPSVVLEVGEEYKHSTIYKVSTL